MKTLILILCLVLLSSCSPPSEVPSHLLIKNGGMTFEQGSKVPFTGVSIEYNGYNGQPKDKIFYKNGREVSTTEFSYHENGQLFIRVDYKDGERDGLTEWYYKNGQLREKGDFKDGKQEGLWEYFDEEGNLTTTEEFKDGELVQSNWKS